MSEQIGPKAFHDAEGTEDWRVLGDGAYAFFRTGSLAESVRFINAIAAVPGIEANPPDIDVRHDGVTRPSPHDRRRLLRHVHGRH